MRNLLCKVGIATSVFVALHKSLYSHTRTRLISSHHR